MINSASFSGFEIVLQALIGVIFALALVFFFWGLAKFILHSAEEEAHEEGRKMMFWGIMALVIMFGIWGIVNFLLSIFLHGSNPVILLPPFPTQVR